MDSERSGKAVWGLVILVTVAGLALALSFVGPPPPEVIRVGTGSDTGAYHRHGEAYARVLERDGLGVELVTSAGSLENLRLLAAGEIDVALVQAGTVRDEFAGRVEGLASVYHEPVWIVARRELAVERLDDLAGLRVRLGAPGSGTRVAARALLELVGVAMTDVTHVDLEDDVLLDAFQRGALDAAFVVSAPDSRVVHGLLLAAEDDLELFDAPRPLAFRRHLRYLREVELGRGLIDPAADLPSTPATLLAPTACLVARVDLHPAVVPLIIEAAREVHGEGGLLEESGDFPSPRGLELPLAHAAETYFRHGPSVLYRVLPFPVAAVIDRLWILLLPLLTLLFPLIKVLPPVLRWRIRSRIYRWYKVLGQTEARLGESPDAEREAEVAEALAALEGEIGGVSVPASYAEELYNLRMHIALVRERLTGGDGVPGAG